MLDRGGLTRRLESKALHSMEASLRAEVSETRAQIGLCPGSAVSSHTRAAIERSNRQPGGVGFLRPIDPLIPKMYLSICAVILSVAAAGKFPGLWMNSGGLNSPDPVFPFLRYRELLALTASLEIVIALAIPLFASRVSLKLTLCVATVFLLYHVGLAFGGPGLECHCLGTLIPQDLLTSRTESLIGFGLLAYLLFGSAALLFVRPPDTSGSSKSQTGTVSRPRLAPPNLDSNHAPQC